MRYLVHIESIDTGEQMPPRQVAAFIEDVVQPTIKALIQWEKDGKAKCGILSGRRGGVVIIDAASNEELSFMLQELLVWGISEVEITPLDDPEKRLKYELESAKMLKQM